MAKMKKITIDNVLYYIEVENDNERFAKEKLFRSKGFYKVRYDNKPAFFKEQDQDTAHNYARFIYNSQGIKYEDIIPKLCSPDQSIPYCDKIYIETYYKNEYKNYFGSELADCILMPKVGVSILFIDTKKCIACGNCFAICDYIVEGPEGKAMTNGMGIIPTSAEIEIENAVSSCPSCAISLQKSKTKYVSTPYQIIQTENKEQSQQATQTMLKEKGGHLQQTKAAANRISHTLLIDTNKCIACGTCFTISNYIAETPDGKAIPKGTGMIPADAEHEIKNVISSCPVHIISLQAVKALCVSDLRQMIQTELRDFTVDRIDRSTLKFDTDAIYIPMAFSPKQYQYDYSSYNRAKNAAGDEINRLMFSQRKSIIQDVLVQYKTQKLRPYYQYEQTNDNFFFQLECNAKTILMRIIDQIKIYKPDLSIPSNLLDLSVRPDKNDSFILIFTQNWFEESNSTRVLNELSGEYYTLNYYANLCDIDDMEMYTGTGLFGHEKYENKYAFKNLDCSFQELANDIKNACVSVISHESLDEACDMVSAIVENYSKKVKSVLNEKAQILESLL